MKPELEISWSLAHKLTCTHTYTVAVYKWYHALQRHVKMRKEEERKRGRECYAGHQKQKCKLYTHIHMHTWLTCFQKPRLKWVSEGAKRWNQEICRWGCEIKTNDRAGEREREMFRLESSLMMKKTPNLGQVINGWQSEHEEEEKTAERKREARICLIVSDKAVFSGRKSARRGELVAISLRSMRVTQVSNRRRGEERGRSEKRVKKLLLPVGYMFFTLSHLRVNSSRPVERERESIQWAE